MRRVLIALMLLLTIAAAETVRVGCYENPPKMYTENGEAKGLWVDITDYIAEEEGWEIEYVQGTWQEHLTRLDNGELDLMPDVAATEARAERWDFTSENVLVSWSAIYVPIGSELDSLLEFEGKRIGVLSGSVNYVGPNGIKAVAESFEVNIEFVEYSSYGDAFVALQAGEVDGAVTNRVFGTVNAGKYGSKDTPIMFSPVEVKYAMPKNAEKNAVLIEAIDRQLAAMKAENEGFYYHTMDKHLGVTEVLVEVLPGWTKWVLGIAVLLVAFFVWAGYTLKEGEEMYRAIADSSPVPMGMIDTAGKFVSVNKAFELSTGFKPSEMVGKTFKELLTPASVKKSVETFSQVIATGKGQCTDCEMKTKSGLKKKFRAQGEITKRRGRPYVVAVFIEDAGVKK
ncbi:transporter substrate-binding domain-containing protein [archaeon]